MNNPYVTKALATERNRESTSEYLFYLITRSPLYVFWLIWDAVDAWSESRAGSGRAMLIGLPALIALLGTGTIGYLIFIGTNKNEKVEYLRAAQQAAYYQDFETASLYYRKLLQSGNTAPEVVLQAAQVAGQLGRQSEREGLLVQLTQGTQSYGPAHLHLAKELLKRPQGAMNTMAKEHLNQALELDASLDDAHILLGHLALAEEEQDQAIEHFERVAGKFPETALTLATLHEQSGNTAETRQWASQAAQEFDKRATSAAQGSEAQTQAIIQWALATSLNKEYAEALARLQRAYQESTNAKLGSAIGSIFAQWSLDTLSGGSSAADDKAPAVGLRRLQHAMQWAPMDHTVLSLIAGLAGLDKNASWQLENSTLETLLAQGEAPWLLHWIIGLQAWKQDDSIQGEDPDNNHLALAMRLNPGSAPILPRVIQFAYTRDQLASQEAFRLLTVVEHEGQSANSKAIFAEIRGMLFAGEEEWQEAIDYFQQALAANERPDLHHVIAKAYEQVGDKRQATLHRRKAEELSDTKDAPSWREW